MIEKKKKLEPAPLVAPDPKTALSDIQYMGGSRYDSFNTEVIRQSIHALWTANSDEKDRRRKQTACLEALAGIAPQDEIEGMLAAQLIACHSAAMECYRRAMIKEQPHEGRQQNLNFANKLTRTYAQAMEALDKHRGKGQQTVRVEHVTVNAGGKAIVGNLQTGVGTHQNSEEQAHAKTIAHAPEQEMRSAFETNGETLPQRCDE